MDQKFCQSCAMPMGTGDDFYGTEVNGSKSADYCQYCYKDGKFTFDGSMEEMIEICIPHMTENNPGMSAEQARQMMTQFFPTLKRWNSRS
ncbi:MAG: zinc ribbon domain-containing protein [Lacrimispora sp.]|uniref:zinc ribbon domain-containing protein n=1 Tax=Lacrimispora sp. TaxID=2719234 RepID=UPI0039E630DB